MDPRPDTGSAARRTLIGMIGTAGVVVVGLGSLAVAGSPSSGEPTPSGRSAAASSTALVGAAPVGPNTDLLPVEAPPGLRSVVGDDGAIVGYLRLDDERQVLDEGEPPIQIGDSAVAFRGLEVVDADGTQVGWFLSGDNGFVSLAEAADPTQLAAIEATWLAEQTNEDEGTPAATVPGA